MRIVIGWVVGCLVLSSCDGGQDVGQDPDDDANADDDANTDDDANADDDANVDHDAGPAGDACAAAPPEPGTPCQEPWSSSAGIGLAYAHCSWGEDPRPLCRTLAVCSSGSWVVTTPTDARCETDPLPAACPADPADSGEVCDDAALDCWYPEGDHCRCSACQGGSEYPVCFEIDPPQWACPEAPAECPSRIPQAGAACDREGASCGPDCELEVVCVDSVWQWNQGICPICAAPNTRIATPTGERNISELALGDLVFSVNAGAIEAVPVVKIGSTPVRHHHVVRVTLQSGAVLELSAGHPTGDGRSIGELGTDDLLDETHRVTDARLVPYAFDRTYDILPDSDSGTYFASGALIGSTLFSPLESR